MVGEYKARHNQYIRVLHGSWFTYFPHSFHWIKYYDCNSLFCVCVFLFSEPEIREEPTFFQYIFHSLLFWWFICAPFSSMFSFYICIPLLCSALLCFSFLFWWLLLRSFYIFNRAIYICSLYVRLFLLLLVRKLWASYFVSDFTLPSVYVR